MRKVDAALGLAQRGFKVFPIMEAAKAPPLVKDWPHKATCDREQIIKWFYEEWPNANIGIHAEGLVVIDVDVKKGGSESFQLLELEGDLPATLVARTPTGGRHVYFRNTSDSILANGVDCLGRGLDIRTQGGYLVAPGSQTAAGVYSFDNAEVEVADAPEWLVSKLRSGSRRAEEPKPEVPVTDAPIALLDRARDWLAHQPGAVEGQGGDAHTFKMACGLRDMGLSQYQALELLTGEWNAKCSPPWTPGELSTKVENAYAYAQNEPGARAARPDEFPVVPAPETSSGGPVAASEAPGQADPLARPPEATRRPSEPPKVYTFAQLASKDEQESAGYIVKGLLKKRSYAEFFGEAGEGKTFLALDLARHVAAGKAWMDRKVHQGTVLYLAFEGTGGIGQRVKALAQKYGDKELPLHFVPATMNLRTSSGAQELAQIVGSLPQVPTLIIIDTFAQALMGGDENSAQDVGAFNHCIQNAIKAYGCSVLILHHPGKNVSKGPRGSSALHGAVDTEIEVTSGAMTPRKQKDLPIGQRIGFKLVAVVVGYDEDEEAVTSCVVEPSMIVSQKTKLTGNNEFGWNVLCELSPNNEPVTCAEWKAACVADFLADTREPAKRFSALKRQLLRLGMIEETKGKVTRTMKGGADADL